MKIKVLLDDRDTDLIHPSVWRQLKVAFRASGELYGVSIEFPGDIETVNELVNRWWEAVGRYRGEPEPRG